MNIQEIIENQVKDGWHKFRMLAENREEGILCCGYVRKNRDYGHCKDRISKHYDLLMLLSGKGYYVDEEVGRIPLEAGDCVQRLPGRKHSTIITDDEWAELYLSVGTDIYKSLANLSVITPHQPVLKTGIDFEMIQMFLEIYHKLDSVNGVELPMLLPKAIELIARATYLHRIHSRTDEETEILKMSVAYVQQNLSGKITVEDVADYVKMGYEKFRKFFQSYYGISPGSFILNQRIRASQTLLADSTISVKEVALELGYSDSAAFSKQFKKVTGHSPTRFREIYHI